MLEHPQPVIKLDGDSAVYQPKLLQQMIVKAGIQHKDVYVIAISGVYRSGKTFFLNLLHTYIDYYIKVKITLII